MDDIQPGKIYNIKYAKHIDTTQPIFKMEQSAVYIQRTLASKNIYETFDSSLSSYLDKLPNSFAKTSVNMLLQKNVIFLSRDVIMSRSGIVGGIAINNDKLLGIGLDVATLQINSRTGETTNIENVFYAAYFEYLRAAVILNYKEISRNKDEIRSPQTW